MKAGFGQALKAARLGKGLTLREFCLKNDLDPGNMSRYERGLSAPPAPGTILRWLQKMGYLNSDHVTKNVLTCACCEMQARIRAKFEALI